MKKEFLSPQLKEQLIEEIQRYMEEERGETLGIIGAQSMMDFFMDSLGERIARRAVELYKERLMLKVEDAEAEVLSNF